jgi:hypothetical protein
MRATGVVKLGRVVFLPGARRVSEVKTGLGSTGGSGGSGNASAPADGLKTSFVSMRSPPGPTGASGPTGKSGPTGGSGDSKPNSAKPASTKPSNPTSPNSSSGDRNAPAVEVVVTTSLRRVVTVQLDAAKQTLARRGAKVGIDLPDGTSTYGRIASVGRVAVASSGGNNSPDNSGSTPKITVTIQLSSPRRAGSLDKAPVSVQFDKVTRRNVLAVPVTALLATAGGGYAVVAGARQIPVTAGLFANGYVEITGAGVRPGLRVRNASG